MMATAVSAGPVQGPSNGWRLLIFKKTVTGSVYSCGCFGVINKVISNFKAMITGTYHGKEKIHRVFPVRRTTFSHSKTITGEIYW